jgi:hypothetical protein
VLYLPLRQHFGLEGKQLPKVAPGVSSIYITLSLPFQDFLMVIYSGWTATSLVLLGASLFCFFANS